MPVAIALTEGVQVEVISAYAAPQQEVPGVSASPGWYVVGAFQLHASADVRLEIIGEVTDGATAMRGRLFDPTAGVAAPVSGSTTSDVTSQVPSARAVSGLVSLRGGRVYQIQVEAVGTGSGVLHTAQLI